VRRSDSQNKNNNKKKKYTYFLFCARVGAAYIFYNVTEQQARGTLSALIHGERGTAQQQQHIHSPPELKGMRLSTAT